MSVTTLVTVLLVSLLTTTPVWAEPGPITPVTSTPVPDMSQERPSPELDTLLQDTRARVQRLEEHVSQLPQQFQTIEDRLDVTDPLVQDTRSLLKQVEEHLSQLIKQNDSWWNNYVKPLVPVGVAILFGWLGLRRTFQKLQDDRKHHDAAMTRHETSLREAREQHEASLREAREHNQRSVRPDMTVSLRSNFGFGTPCGLFLVNNGLGPGTILELKIIYRGKAYEDLTSLKQLCKDTEALNHNYGMTLGWMAPGNSLSPGKEFGFLAFPPDFNPQPDIALQLENVIEGFRVVGNFQDFYGKKEPIGGGTESVTPSTPDTTTQASGTVHIELQ